LTGAGASRTIAEDARETSIKVLLLNTFQRPEATAGNYKRFLSPMPPITIAYLAAALEKAGVEVRFYDDVLNYADEAAFSETLRTFRPRLVGISVVTGTVGGAERAAKIVRREAPEARIVMGNIHADLFAEQYLKSGLTDFVVHGEGEETVVELAKALDDRAPDFSKVRGITYLDDGAPRRTPERPFIEDLDSLPFPAWHLFPLERYRLFNFARVWEPGTLVLGSRGCPFTCSFCTLTVNQSTVRRRRSAKNIADEFEWLHDRFGYRQASFVDPIFPFHPKEGSDFADELIRRGLHEKMVWITETRVDLVDDALMAKMRASGLRRVMYGFETGSAAALARIRKAATLDKGIQAARIAKRNGVSVVGFFMLGIPDSTKADLEATIDYATNQLDIDFAKFTVFVPYPGTPDYDRLKAAGELREPENWKLFTSYPTDKRPPAYVPKGLTAEEIIEYQRKAYLSFYVRPRMIYHQLVNVRALGLKDMFDGLRLMASPGR
jgi:anaerobic magnesium-protoporphyrin IX monomethyl ester cyclase